MILGGVNRDGDLFLHGAANQTTIHFDGGSGDIRIGGNGRDGDLRVWNQGGEDAIHLNGNRAGIVIGRNGLDGKITVRAADGSDIIVFDGTDGTDGTITCHGVVISTADGAVDVLDRLKTLEESLNDLTALVTLLHP